MRICRPKAVPRTLIRGARSSRPAGRGVGSCSVQGEGGGRKRAGEKKKRMKQNCFGQSAATKTRQWASHVRCSIPSLVSEKQKAAFPSGITRGRRAAETDVDKRPQMDKHDPPPQKTLKSRVIYKLDLLFGLAHVPTEQEWSRLAGLAVSGVQQAPSISELMGNVGDERTTRQRGKSCQGNTRWQDR
ncbi:hypothetical protein LZ31DRAFT_292927 [Colletotrichum somersetense]|nr:hypothetical protein LZ31DRAFT_292927 [Colletotrichum somersetense]